MHKRIIELYGPHILRRSALSIREGAGVIERVMAGRGYRTALEIGTYRGVGAAVMAQFCGRVVTIDLHHGRMEQLGDTHDRASFWRTLGIDNVDLQLVADNTEKWALLDGLDFDFAFLDGAKDAATVAGDFARVKRCGTVLFHDYDRRGGIDQDHVCDFIDSLPRAQVEKMDIFALWRAP